MKTKVILLLSLLAIAGYTGYNNFMKGGADVDEKNVRTSFNSMTMSIMSKSKVAVQNFLSPAFTDKSVTREDLARILTVDRGIYRAKIQSIKTEGDLASIFYTRTESRGSNSQTITSKISGETWIRDGKNPAIWRLQKLAANDKWFRVAKLPQKTTAVTAKKKSDRVLGGLEKGHFKFVSMKPGDNYSSVGKRDPFKSLIAFEIDVGTNMPEVCDQDRPRELLESFDLPSLKLSGVIMGGSSGAMALIETPDGKGYSIFQGTYIGKRCGKISKINKQFILVEEKIRKTGVQGVSFDTVETSLKLRPEEG